MWNKGSEKKTRKKAISVDIAGNEWQGNRGKGMIV